MMKSFAFSISTRDLVVFALHLSIYTSDSVWYDPFCGGDSNTAGASAGAAGAGGAGAVGGGAGAGDDVQKRHRSERPHPKRTHRDVAGARSFS